MKLSTIAVRNLARNRRRSILSIVAIAVAAAAISFLFALLAGYTTDIEYNLQSYYTGAVRIRNVDYDRYDYLNPLHLSIQDVNTLASRLEEHSAVSALSLRIPFSATLFEEEDRHTMVGLGVDMERDRRFQDLDNLLLAGRLPGQNSREALLAAGLAERLDMGVGDTLTILTTTKFRGNSAMSFEIVGILGYPVAGLNSSQLLVPLAAAQRLTRMENEVTELLIKTESGVEAGALARELEDELLTPQLIAQSWEEINMSYSLLESAQASYNIIALFFVFLGSTVVINTTMMVIFERLREIGTLAALGMTGSRLVTLFFLESLFIALLGGLVGVAIGSGVAWPLSIFGMNLGTAFEGVSFELSSIVRPQVTLYSTVVVFIATVTIASLASLVVSRRVSRIDPVEALAAP